MIMPTAMPGGHVDLGQRGDLLGDDRAEPGPAEVVGHDDEVAAEVLVDHVARPIALIDAPNVVNRATTAVPIISAEALPAVRRGSRIALRRASRPVWPRRRLGTQPSTLAAGRATTGPSTTAPTSVSSAPSPARVSAWSADGGGRRPWRCRAR